MPPITRSQSRRGLCLSKEESIVPPGTAVADDTYYKASKDEQRTRDYWEFYYGASGEGNAARDEQAKSWSANRAPPVKSCLSSKKRAHATTTTKSTSIPTRGKSQQQQRSPTPMLSDRFNFGVGDGRLSIGHTHHYSPMTAKEVKFGSPSAAEFYKSRPPVELTPLPAGSAREMFSVDGKVDSPDDNEEFDGETARNDAELAKWEDGFDALKSDRRTRRRRQSGRHGTKRRQSTWLRGGDEDRRNSSFFFALSSGTKSLLDLEASEANVETARRKEEEEEEEEEELAPVQLDFCKEAADDTETKLSVALLRKFWEGKMIIITPAPKKACCIDENMS